MIRRVLTIFLDRFGVGTSPAPASTAAAAAAANTAGATIASSTGTTSTTATSTSAIDFSGFAPSVTALAGTLARVEQHAEDQITSKAQTSADTRQLAPRRADLVGRLRSIAGVAKTLKSQVPGIGILKAPASGMRADTLVNEAQAFASNAQIYAAVLIEKGQPGDFVAQLTASTAAFKDAIASKGASLQTQRGATAGLKAEIAAGRLVVNQINATMQQLLRNSPADLAAWNSARRVTNSLSGSTGSVVPVTATAPAGTAAGTSAGTSAAPAAALAVGQTQPVVSQTSSVASETAPAAKTIAQGTSAS